MEVEHIKKSLLKWRLPHQRPTFENTFTVGTRTLDSKQSLCQMIVSINISNMESPPPPPCRLILCLLFLFSIFHDAFLLILLLFFICCAAGTTAVATSPVLYIEDKEKRHSSVGLADLHAVLCPLSGLRLPLCVTAFLISIHVGTWALNLKSKKTFW